jgi:hypothetical protein
MADALQLRGTGPLFADRVFSAMPESWKSSYYFAVAEYQAQPGRDKQHYHYHENKLDRIHIAIRFNCSHDINCRVGSHHPNRLNP